METANNKTRITADIFGVQYKLVGNSSEAYMREIAEYVHEQMSRISKAYPRLDTSRIAVLASVNMADDFFKLRADFTNAQQALRDSQQAIEAARRQSQPASHPAVDHGEQQQLMQLHELKTTNAHLQSELDDVLKQLNELKEEHAKLITEFNEWIELAPPKPSDSE